MMMQCLLLSLLLMTSGLLGFGKLALPLPCGQFDFNRDQQTGINGDVNISVTFSFDPKKCLADILPKPHCQCKKIGFIQIIRFIDPDAPDTGPFFYQPNAVQQQRMIEDPPRGLGDLLFAWAVDRYEDIANPKIFGYYGVDDSGNPLPLPGKDAKGQQLFEVQFGSNSTPAMLLDSPQVAGHLTQGIFQAITVPVCMDDKPEITENGPETICTNCLLGYYRWSYKAQGNTVVQGSLSHSNASDYHRDAFDQAVVRWNKQTEGLNAMHAFGKTFNPFPILYRF